MANLLLELVPVCRQRRSGAGFGVVGVVARGRQAGPVASPWGTLLRSCLGLPLGFPFARPGSAAHLMNKEQLQEAGGGGGANTMCDASACDTCIRASMQCGIVAYEACYMRSLSVENQALNITCARTLDQQSSPQMYTGQAHLAACFPCLLCPASLPFNVSSPANFGMCPSPPAASSPTLPDLVLGDPAFFWAPFTGEAPSAVAGTYEHNGSGGLFGLLQGRACASRKALLAGPC